MDVNIFTRFSFFGDGGWKHESSEKPKELFASERMEKRFAMFEYLTIPSLLSQNDGDYRWFILSSAILPSKYQKRLDEMVKDQFSDRVSVHYEPPAKAGKYFRNFVMDEYEHSRRVINTVLDDDDVFARNFVKSLRVASGQVAEEMEGEDDYCYLTFPCGYRVQFMDEVKPIYTHYEEWINLGLASVSRADFKRNPLSTNHRMIPDNHPHKIYFRGRPLYMRSLHDTHDSRILKQLQKEQPDAKPVDMSELKKTFPFISKAQLRDLKEAYLGEE